MFVCIKIILGGGGVSLLYVLFTKKKSTTTIGGARSVSNSAFLCVCEYVWWMCMQIDIGMAEFEYQLDENKIILDHKIYICLQLV